MTDGGADRFVDTSAVCSMTELFLFSVNVCLRIFNLSNKLYRGRKMSEENKMTNGGEPADNNDNNVTEQENKVSKYSYSFERIYEDSYDEEPQKPKKPKKISISAFLLSSVAIVLATVMLTFTVCMGLYRKTLSDIINEGFGAGAFESGDSQFADLDKLDAIFKTYSYYGLEEEDIVDIVLKSYVAATGDRYAEYFTEEEYEAYMDSMMGSTEGVGINIIYTTEVIGGVEYKVFRVTNVTKESPAMRAGMKFGDIIFYVGIDEDERQSVNYLGYDEAFSMLIGPSGTQAEFTVLRKTADGAGYEEIEFSITREPITSESVYYHVCATDPSVGIVKLLKFDYTTPTQFCEAVDELRAKGIDKFVFDVRYNGGGRLDSIVAVLSYFLDEGQTIISTVDKEGRADVIKAGVISGLEGERASCNVSRKDIGKYKDLEVAVLCNSSTASAAELFVANFRDYGIAKIVGQTTFGKGSMQSTLSLHYFGMKGVLKLTTNLYFPPCGESYDGIGITPDIEIPLDEALQNVNIYEISDAEDNQLQAALNTLK